MFWLSKAFEYRVLNISEMSRCFPFPPPGYEKKARIENEDLLKKEKEKEKKHKKEKKDKDKDKDKEKREKKEKKEKDKSDGKHKDKKDKKEKHRDKKKEKDRDKEKDRSNISDEKKFHGLPGVQNGEKISDEKILHGKSEGQSGDKFIQKEKGRDKDRSSTLDDKKHAGQFLGYNGQKVSQNSNLAEDFRDSKFVQGRRIRDEGPGAGTDLQRSLWLTTKSEMSKWSDWWLRLPTRQLKGWKRTREVMIVGWMCKESGRIQALVEMLWSRTLVVQLKLELKGSLDKRTIIPRGGEKGKKKPKKKKAMISTRRKKAMGKRRIGTERSMKRQ